jgi:assimilatory nitrate reductase catalytic subunit
MLNSGRYRDHWHSMTRTGLSPRLSRHRSEPLVEVHPDDAAALGIDEGDLVRIETPQGTSLFRARLTTEQRRGEIFTPIHWTDCHSNGGRTALLISPLTDPHSGQPGFKATPARMQRMAADWRAFLIARHVPDAIDALYATRIRIEQGWLVEMMGAGEPAALADQLMPKGLRIEANDHGRGEARGAVLADGRLEAALFVSKRGRLPRRDWLIAQLAAAAPASANELLVARPSVPVEEQGPLICACFEIGALVLARAIAAQRMTSVEEVGSALRAGTNCGSCRPAIHALLHQDQARAHG